MAGQSNNYGKRSHSFSDYDDNGRNKRKNTGEGRESYAIGPEDTVYRYLCPVRKIGSIMGRGGDIVRQIRTDTRSKIRIGETVLGCDERVVTIYSSGDETNDFDGLDISVCPSQDALFRIFDRVINDDTEESEEGVHVTVRLLVPSDQIGCIIGKGGQIVQSIRSDTGAQIRILKDDYLPRCALSSDELVQISGEAPVARKALYKVACCLHDNPSRSQQMLISATPNAYASSGSVVGPAGGAPIMGLGPLVGSYSDYRDERGDWSRPFYAPSRDELSSMEFSLNIICHTANIGSVIGKGGAIINQIRQESGATIKVDSSAAVGDDCLIAISAKEFLEDTFSPTIEAAMRLQPRCSEKVESDSGRISFTTRILVPTSQIGCIIGKGGSIITEMRSQTKANIRVLSKENLPKVASDGDEMVLISGDLDVAKEAFLQVTSRLRANLFEREAAVSAFVPVLPYLPMSADATDSMRYESRESRRHGREHSYSGGYGGSGDLPAVDTYGSYGSLHTDSGYGGYSSGRHGSSGLSGQNSASRRKSYGY